MANLLVWDRISGWRVWIHFIGIKFTLNRRLRRIRVVDVVKVGWIVFTF